MDFDEYDYLEKAVENPELPIKEGPPANGVRSGGAEKSRSSKQRQEDDEVEAKRPGSRARGDDEGAARGHDRGRDRIASRQRSSPERASGSNERPGKDKHRSGGEHRDRDRDRDKEKDERIGRGRESEKNRGRDMEKSRERMRERNRETEWERDREREFVRRGRIHPERQRDEERDRPKDRESRARDRAPKEKEMRDREPGVRRQKEKKEDGVEPEADPERDQRTVFAYQIHLRADERDVYEFFSRAGKVRDVRLIMDRNSRRSKGVGYIEFYDVLSVPMAIALSGQLLMGQPVMVKPSEAEKNLVQSTAAAASSGGGRKLYVGNLHLGMTEEQLRQVFEPFGQVELVQLPLDPETQKCKGYGFIQFARLEDAKAAQNLNGQLEIAGRVIKVSAVTDQPGAQDAVMNTGDFDDDGDLALNASSRALLMQKLDRSGMATSVGSPLVPTGTNGMAAVAAAPQADPIGVPSECLLLKNMFDPTLETEPDFDLDIKEDVQEECSKFGPLKHIFVDKNSTGLVYLRFESTSSAISAQRALHGRWFAGKMITASFMLPYVYLEKFPPQS